MTAVAANRPTLYDSKTTSKLSIFSLTRLLLMSAVLLTTVFLRQEVLGTTALTQIYVALTASFFITLINVTYWEQTLRIKYFVASQLLYDLLLTSYLVYLTGVNDSIFLFLYLINILSASAVYRMQGALVVMALSGVTFAAIYYVNIDMENTTAWYNLLWNELLFLLTALLCGQFMEEIKRQQVLLDVQQENITKLQILNDRLLNSIPAGIALVDAQEYVTNVNATALQLLGLAHPPAMRMKYYELLPEIKGLLEAWEHLGET